MKKNISFALLVSFAILSLNSVANAADSGCAFRDHSVSGTFANQQPLIEPVANNTQPRVQPATLFIKGGSKFKANGGHTTTGVI